MRSGRRLWMRWCGRECRRESAVLDSSRAGSGHAAPMRYYYFWYVVRRDGGEAGRYIGSTGDGCELCVGRVWACGDDCALLPILSEAEGSTARTSIAIGLLAVTGLDLIPVAVAYLQGQPTDPDMEWWSQGQVTSWMDTLLWVPHHMAAWCAACSVFCWYGCRRTRDGGSGCCADWSPGSVC